MDIDIFDEDLNVIVNKSIKRKSPSMENESFKKRKRGEGYIEDNTSRSNCRCSRRKGILNDMRILKLCTGDRTYLEICHADTGKVSIYSTCPASIIKHKRNVDITVSPTMLDTMKPMLQQSKMDSNIFDEHLNLVAEKTKKQTLSTENETLSTKNETLKKRKRGEGYIEDTVKRRNCRYSRRKGLFNDMRILKLCTGDETYLEFCHADTGNISSYSTSPSLIVHKRACGSEEMTEVMHTTPSHGVLSPMWLTPASNVCSTPTSSPCDSNSPSRQSFSNSSVAAKTLDEFDCQVCKVRLRSDKDLDSPWVGCSEEKCKYWVHLICIGFKVSKNNVKNFKQFWCPEHIQKHIIKVCR